MANKKETSPLVKTQNQDSSIDNEHAQIIQRAMTLGVKCLEQRELDSAYAMFSKILTIDKNHVGALLGLCLIATENRRYGAAYQLVTKALKIEPENAWGCHNNGVVLAELNKLDLAESSLRKAIKIKPDYTSAHVNLGLVLERLNKTDEAKSAYEKVIEIDPYSVRALNGLGNIYQGRSDLDTAIEYFKRAYEVDKSNFLMYSNILMCMSSRHDTSPIEYLDEAKRFGKAVMARATPYKDWPLLRIKSGKVLRIGFVSADLRNHPVALFLKNFLSKAGNSNLQFVAYNNHRSEDHVTAELKPLFSEWNSIEAMSDQEAAKKIRDDAINILVDLSGHTGLNRLPLFAWRPAPIQATWMGYFASTGVPTIDYLMRDSLTSPEEFSSHYTEKVWDMKATGCFTPPGFDIAVEDLPALSNEFVTFGSFHSLAKLNDEVVSTWSKVLLKVENSRLYLKSKGLESEYVLEQVLARFEKQGVKRNRILTSGFTGREDYLRTYNSIDIALDPFPWSGGTTNVECLWMGVPFVALKGDRLASNIGSAALIKAGLDDWVASDIETYVDLAVEFASDLPKLKEVRSELREQVLSSVLFDGNSMIEDLERSFRGMWDEFCTSESDNY